MIKNYLIIAYRNLYRNKVLSFINISGLSIGIACCILIFLFTKDEITFDGFHSKKKSLYRLTCKVINNEAIEKKFGITFSTQGPSFKNAIPEIKDYVRINGQNLNVKHGNETFNESVTWVDPNFFSVFSFPLIIGNSEKVLANKNSIVLTEEMAKKYFGTANAIGKTIEVEMDEKFQPFEITGIANQCPQNSSIQFNMLISFKAFEEIPDNSWFNLSFPTFLVLNDKANVLNVEAKMKQVFQINSKEQLIEERKQGFTGSYTYGLQPFLDMHLNESYDSTGISKASNPIYSYILIAIASLILSIACFNFLNIAIAQSLKRSKEIGLRKVIGGEKRHLITQFLVESYLLCFIAFVIAVLLAQSCLPMFNKISNKQLSLSYLFDFYLVVGYVLLFLITGLAAGAYPAFILSGFKPVQTLYNRTNFLKDNYFGKGLIVIQFFLSSFLIISTLFTYKQFNYLTTKSLGYNDKNLIEINVGDRHKNKLQQTFKTEFAQSFGISKVAPRMDGNWGTYSCANGKKIKIRYEHIDEDYFPLLEVPIVAGRNFSKDFPADSSNSVIVNEAYVREADWKDSPIGKTVDFLNGQNTKFLIIGVVKDYHYESLKEKIKPQLFSTSSHLPFGRFLLRIDGKNIPKTIKEIELVYHKLAPFRPFEYHFSEDLNNKNYEAEDKWKQIITFATTITIFISCIGLFGLSKLSAEKRTKEIGIRKVMGASISQIVILLTKDFLKLVVISFLIAVPLSWYFMNKWLQNFAYRIEISWWMFAIAGILSLLIALLTISFQAIKAAMANPIESLRTE